MLSLAVVIGTTESRKMRVKRGVSPYSRPQVLGKYSSCDFMCFKDTPRL